MDFKIECERKGRKRYSACTPKDLDLPFFAYGFFKPHQIAHSEIEIYMNKIQTEEATVNGYIMHVNGMPVLKLNKRGRTNVLGNIIHFKRRYRKKAYETIGYSKHIRIYKWEEIEINGTKVNTLVSSTPKELGKFHKYERNMEYVINEYVEDGKSIQDYDWRLDPLYDATISQIRFLMNNPNNDKKNEHSQLITTQMLYTSLWTSLDKFLTYKYGETKRGNVEALSEEDYFVEILEDVLSRKYNDTYVFSAQDLYSYNLDISDPTESALYYYTLRNNVVHSGKMFASDNEMLSDALKELLEIFERILEVVRNE